MYILHVDFFKKIKTSHHRGTEKNKRKAKENKIAADKRFPLLLFFLRVSVSLCERFGFYSLNRQHII
jgi:hypothetical protein